jgi:hypothetical protein
MDADPGPIPDVGDAVFVPGQPLAFAQTAIEDLEEPSRSVRVAIDRGPT